MIELVALAVVLSIVDAVLNYDPWEGQDDAEW